MTKREFQRLYKEGKRFVGRCLCINYLTASKPRLGMSVNKRYGSSPERNRFKRLVREVFRKRQPPFELNVIPRQLAKRAKERDIQDDFARFFNEAQ